MKTCFFCLTVLISVVTQAQIKYRVIRVHGNVRWPNGTELRPDTTLYRNTKLFCSSSKDGLTAIGNDGKLYTFSLGLNQYSVKSRAGLFMTFLEQFIRTEKRGLLSSKDLNSLSRYINVDSFINELNTGKLSIWVNGKVVLKIPESNSLSKIGNAQCVFEDSAQNKIIVTAQQLKYETYKTYTFDFSPTIKGLINFVGRVKINLLFYNENHSDIVNIIGKGYLLDENYVYKTLHQVYKANKITCDFCNRTPVPKSCLAGYLMESLADSYGTSNESFLCMLVSKFLIKHED